MLKRFVLLAILTLSVTALNALDIPWPSCLPCPEGAALTLASR